MLRVLSSKLTLWYFKQDDAERQGWGSSAERVEPDKLRHGGFLLGFLRQHQPTENYSINKNPSRSSRACVGMLSWTCYVLFFKLPLY